MDKIISFFITIILFCNVTLTAQWTKLSTPINKKINCFIVQNDNLFVGTDGMGIYMSSNNGTNWVTAGLSNKKIRSLAINGPNLLAGTDLGLFSTSNNGNIWLSIADGDIYSVVANINKIYFSKYYILSGGFVVSSSTNNGVNWTELNYPHSNDYKITFFKLLLTDQYLYGVGDSSVYYSGWVHKGTKIYRTNNDGYSWSYSCSAGSDYIDDFYVIKLYGSRIYRSSYGAGSFYTDNWGNSWINFSTRKKDFEFSGSNLLAVDNGSIVLTTNNGVNWVDISTGIVNSTIEKIIINGSYIYAGATNGDIWRRAKSEVIGINQISTNVPDKYNLSQNYPNPFNPVTNIEFSIPKNGNVKLTVFDMTGKEVAVLLNKSLSAGTYKVDFNGENLSSGIYFYKLQVGDFVNVKKMVFIK